MEFEIFSFEFQLEFLQVYLSEIFKFGHLRLEFEAISYVRRFI